jgi:hypothetical protein
MYAVTLYHPPGITLRSYINSKGLFRYEFAIIAWVCGALLIVRQLTILNQIILHRAAAVWIARDRLFYLNIYWDIIYRSIPLSDVAKFEVKSDFAAHGGIVVRLRNGQERVISTWLLSEPVDAVIARLRAVDGGEA